MHVSRSALLPYSAAQMFAIVADVETYPEFLKWCTGVDILNRQEDAIDARMHISYAKLSFAFTTRNISVKNRKIDLSLIEGPFQRFSGCWEFLPLGEENSQPESKQGCKTSLEMTFEFDKGLASAMLGKMFEKIASAQLSAFQKRAQEIYADGMAVNQ